MDLTKKTDWRNWFKGGNYWEQKNEYDKINYLLQYFNKRKDCFDFWHQMVRELSKWQTKGLIIYDETTEEWDWNRVEAFKRETMRNRIIFLLETIQFIVIAGLTIYGLYCVASHLTDYIVLRHT